MGQCLRFSNGSHLYVEVSVAGNFFNGTVYSPAAYAKGRVKSTIPNNGWYLYYHFEWEDMNHVTDYQESCNYYTNGTAGFQVRIDCKDYQAKYTTSWLTHEWATAKTGTQA